MPTRALKSGDAPGGLDLAGVLADDVEDAERGAGGALRIVLVGARNPEERGDPVAHVRLDRAAELLDRLASCG